MTIFQALILGIVQGATEFIPVSSSAHLVLVPWLLGWTFDLKSEFAFDVLVQWGTLAAVVVYFWRDLVALIGAAVRGLMQHDPLGTPEARLAWLIVVATIPAAVLGATFKDFFESVFSAPATVAALLLVTGAILALSEWLGRRARSLNSLTWRDAIIVGLAQAVSILPGISRSGATIAGGLGRGLQREVAARFSFLISVPIIFGAGLIPLKDLAQAGSLDAFLPALSAGIVGAAITGFVSIAALLAYLRRQPLYVFAVYCWAFGVFCLLIALLGIR